MKRILAALLILCLSVPVFAGCGSPAKITDTTAPASPPDTPSQTTETEPPETEPPETQPAQTAPPPFDSADADVDLTGSATVAYAALYAMMEEPEAYMGKTVCLRGAFSTYEDPFSGARFYGCVITDVTACCAQGMEFEPAAEYTFPEDYPEENGEITVFGTFDTYLKNGYTFCILRNAKLY